MTLLDARPLAQVIYRRFPSYWTVGLEAFQGWRHGGKRPPARLDVMTSIGGSNLDVLQVLLQSLAETHPRDRIQFWLFYMRLAPQDLTDLSAFVAGLPNLTLNLVQVQERKDFDLLSKLGQKPYGARFLWYTAHLYLPADIKRIIYLDPLDTIVTNDLLPFLKQPLLGQYLAACREAPFAPPLICGPARQAAARGASPDKIRRISKGVLNSGAIVINLDKLRRDRVGIDAYIETARWAQAEMGLSFGDQGLFSLTHGSNYVRAHDRYNFRFHMAPARGHRLPPAVVHFAGRIPKPFHLRLTPDQERQITAHLERTGARELALNPTQKIKRHDLAYYRQWWDICARTPVYDRIAPLAGAYATKVLSEQLPALQDTSVTPSAR